MNKYRKKKSREIRDIMRTDRWRRMSYKEAKRKWRKGIRAFRVGDPKMDAWFCKDLAHLGFTRAKMKKVGEAYYKVIKYCAERNLGFNCHYERFVDAYILRFNGRSVDGKSYGVSYTVSCNLLRNYRGSLMDIAHRTLDEVNCRLQEFRFPSIVEPRPDISEMYPRVIIHDWKIERPDAVFGKIVDARIEKLRGGV